MSNLKFAETHNLVAFLEKPKESDGFEGIIDFLNASSIRYALTIQALVDGKKVIVTERFVRRGSSMKRWEREGKGFSRRVTPLFQTMMVQAQEEGEGSEMPTVPQHTSTINQPSSSQPPKKQKPRKTKKQNTKDRLKLNELLELCTKLSKRVLDLENTKTSQAVEITKLKERVKKLERRNKSRTSGLKRLRKRRIVDEAQGKIDDNLMFDTRVFDEQEFEVKKVGSTAKVTTASATTTTVDELTLAQTLIEIKAAKPKVVTTTATTTTTAVMRPKARGVVVQEPSEFRTITSSSQTSQLPQVKDKGKAKMIEPERPLKKKDQILVDEEIAQRLQEELQAKLEEEERLARQKEEEDNLISWDNTQAMIEADYDLAQRLQAEEQGELTIEEKSKLFVKLMDKRKKYFAKLRAEEIRRNPPTKAQKRNQMCNYLKNMANYKHSQLKNKIFEEIQMLFDNTMKWVDSFVPIDTKVVEGSKSQAEGSKKRTREELESDNSKKKKIDENVEAEVDDEDKMKKLMEIVPDGEVGIDAIPLATKSPIIVDWKIIKEGKIGYFQIIRADGSSRAKHGNTRPEEAYEKVLWGDLKVMFEPDVESEVWSNLQGYNVTVWKLFSSSGVYFMRFQNLHIFMLVEKKYPLTPATITKMLHKKLQTD
ncbi:hypothetical protein Tco_1270301 [Tanacetum coccineum]